MWPFRKKQPSTPKPKDQLVFAFKTGGKNYYQFTEGMAIPLSRLSQIQEFSIIISRGLTNAQIDLLTDRMDELLTDGLTKNRNAAKIGALVNEIRNRKNTVVLPELYLNYLACYYIREDESIELYNAQIQQEKVDAFRVAANDENSFFFRLTEYSRLIELLSSSIKNWSDIENEYQAQVKRFDEVMRIISLGD